MPAIRRATAPKGDRIAKTPKERVREGWAVSDTAKSDPTLGAMAASRGKKVEEARKNPPKPKAKPAAPKAKAKDAPKPKAKPAQAKPKRTAGGQSLKRDRFTGR